MNFSLPHIPDRPARPRDKGVTMVMDKGLSLKQAENFMDACSDYVDFVKLGFGTSYITRNLQKKLDLYKEAGIKTYFGGTLFEAFVVRGMFNDYLKLLDKFKMEVAEVSDGSIVLAHSKKCEFISKLSKDHLVLSEVGSKEEGIIIHPAKWISMMKKEIEAGSWKVIAEAREGGNVGIFHRNGSAHTLLINKITAKVERERIIWETPQKSQQVYFIKLFGANVNLGNIGFDDVIPLETLRLGLRGDTFFTFLPKNLEVKTEK
ncbi:MAG TPA: phosphosulfolactate synthase [Bacteroidia bacterium]|jgi:phosphosulfolactate synthase